MMIYLSSINNSKIMKVSNRKRKKKANRRLKLQQRNDDIIKDLRQLREQKVQMLKNMN